MGNEKMLRYTLLAGERALESYAWEEATQHFIRGLEAKGIDLNGREPAADAQAADLLFGLARAKSAYFSFWADIGQTVSNLRSAFEYRVAAGDSDRAVEIAQSPPRLPVGGRSGLMDIMEAALNIAAPGSSAKGQLWAHYGWVAGVEDADYPAAERAFREALEIARDNNDSLLLQRTLAQAAQVDFYHGRNYAAIEKTRQILTISAADLDLTTECAARYVYCISANYIGEPASPQELGAFINAAERLGNQFWVHLAYWVSSIVALLRGDWERARQLANRAVAAAPGAPTILSSASHIELETGEFDRAQEIFQKLLGLLAEIPANPSFHFPAVLSVDGRVSWFTGTPREPALPVKVADIVMSSPFAIPAFVAVNFAGMAYDALARGNQEACHLAYDGLASFSGACIHAIASDRLLGMLSHAIGDVSQATGHFEDSLAFCAKAGYRPEYAWTCWGYSAALLDRGNEDDRRRAEGLLAEALQISTGLGMPPLMERIASLQETMGAGLQPPPAYPNGLTFREVEVLLLLSQGRTNREIARVLVLSQRTVERHISNLYTKIAVRNRAEATLFALNQLAPSE